MSALERAPPLWGSFPGGCSRFLGLDFLQCAMPGTRNQTVVSLIYRRVSDEDMIRVEPPGEKLQRFWERLFASEDGANFIALHLSLKDKTP